MRPLHNRHPQLHPAPDEWGESFPFLPSIELEGHGGAAASPWPSVLLSPSPLKALRACPESLEGERGIKGVRVPLWGRGASPQIAHLPYLNPRAILLPRPPTSHLGAHHNAGSKESHEPHKPTQAPSQPSSIPPPGPRHAPPPTPFPSPSCTPTPTTSAAQRPNVSAFAAINHRPAPCKEGPRTNHGTPYSRAIARCAPHS